MRICLVCTEKLPVPPVRGGAIQTYIAAVAPLLARAHEVTVLCRRDPALPESEADGALRYVRLPAGSRDRYYTEVATYLASALPFDGVVVYNRPAYLPQIGAVAKGARLFLSLHNEMLHPDRIRQAEAMTVLDRTEKVITISDYIREQIAAIYPSHAAKLHTVRAGVDLAQFQPIWSESERRLQLRERLGIPADAPVILHVSRFSPKKGNHLVIEAMGQVRQSHPEAMLLVVGSSRYGTNNLDQYGRSVHEQAARLLGDQVRFTGFIPPAEIADLYLAGDIFVCASQWPEPLARVHYEAMASGLPIITTDRGGNGEVVAEGGNGLFARPHHLPAAFAQQIRTLLDAPALRSAMGAYGRSLAADRYTWVRVAAQLVPLLEGR